MQLLLNDKSIYFIDEFGISCDARKNRGRSKSGSRVVDSDNIKSQLKLTVLAAINWEGSLDYIIIDGNCKGKDFVGFICQLIKRRGII